MKMTSACSNVLLSILLLAQLQGGHALSLQPSSTTSSHKQSTAPNSIALSQSRRLALSTLSTLPLLLLPNAARAAAAAASIDDAPSATTRKQPSRKFQRYPQIRFIAALSSDPNASSGTGSDAWGLWRDDPSPRGVYLRDYDKRIASNKNVAPAGWTFDPADWWVEEHGLIMSAPGSLPRRSRNKETGEVVMEKRYVVTGDREVTTILTVREDGTWELEKGSLYDVTHLPCRSARYTDGSSKTCAPKNANGRDFPVKPGAVMPAIDGCEKQDYAVLFVLGEEV